MTNKKTTAAKRKVHKHSAEQLARREKRIAALAHAITLFIIKEGK